MLSYQEYVKSVQQDVAEIDIQTLTNNQQQYDLIIDIRETPELSSGKISGAVHIPRGLLEAKIITLAPEKDEVAAKYWLSQQQIVLYCASGARSALSAKSLNEMGLDKVCSLSGGFNAYKTAGLPIDSAS